MVEGILCNFEESSRTSRRWYVTPHCLVEGHFLTTYPSEVKRVWAVGKPPEDKLCFFRNLKNVVVFPTSGESYFITVLT